MGSEPKSCSELKGKIRRLVQIKLTLEQIKETLQRIKEEYNQMITVFNCIDKDLDTLINGVKYNISKLVLEAYENECFRWFDEVA